MTDKEKIEKKDDTGFTQRLIDFIQKKRGVFLGCCVALIAALAAFIAVAGIQSSLNTKALSQAEDLNRRYETLRFDINDASKDEDVKTLLDDLANFASKHKGFASARAYAITASIHSDKKNWPDAEKAWANTAGAAKGGYLEAVALYNEAVALEEQNNTQGAIDLFTKAAAFADFPGASRAQFNIGRLQEGVSKDAAIEAYRSLVSKWPDDTVWTTLAQSRIIALGIK